MLHVAPDPGADVVLALVEKLRASAVRPIDRERAVVVGARAAIDAAVRSFLLHARMRIAGSARKVAKASAEEDEAEAIDYGPLHDAVAPELVKVAADGAAEALQQVIDPLDTMLSQVNQRAVAWAEARAGELITQVAETTRTAVREKVAQALDEGWSNKDLADAIEEDDAFSDSRAEMIARTETASADVQGNLIGWAESGVVAEKQWIVGGGECDECAALEGAVVALDESFEDGVDGPPLHPNCRCDLLPVVGDQA